MPENIEKRFSGLVLGQSLGTLHVHWILAHLPLYLWRLLLFLFVGASWDSVLCASRSLPSRYNKLIGLS